VFLGKLCAISLMETVEALFQVKNSMELIMGNIGFIAQHDSNAHGRFLAIVEDGGRGQRGFVVIPKGKSCRAMRDFMVDM
jgi:hypothetical protein